MNDDFTISFLRARIARGELSHEALVEQVLEAAGQPAAQHVFTRLYADAALAAARHADAARKAGLELPTLAGLPVSVKDLYDIAGETTMTGSAVCAGEPAAAHDAAAVARLRTQGAAIVGKTNMTEFAFSGVGINPHYGTPRNPADAQTPRIPGGSSSGAAVSVALPPRCAASSASRARSRACRAPAPSNSRARSTPSAPWPAAWKTA